MEDTAHFILLCPLYANQRTHLTNVVEEIIGRHNLVVVNHVDLYLSGHPSLNFVDNQKILLSTLTYVKGTARFVF